MSEHYDFHYQPTGSGAISGQQVLQQTEDAINELGDYVNNNVGGAMDVAQQALETAQNAEQDAQTALDTANSFSSAIQSAQQDASTALSTAQTAQTTASNANNTAIQAQQDASSAVTTANNASGQVSTLSGTVTALGQRVTTAEGNIGQNTSDITALTTRVGTAEGNITTLQNDVTIAQGNASSAMATAGTVKQQAYVLRYSSTAITDNSTIAYSTLDNTDNIKASDKIIDSNGKIFSVVSVDTTNQTVTVGSALIDLALDANVVHTSGNETITGTKTLDNVNLPFKNSAELGVSGGSTNITFSDKNGQQLCALKAVTYSSGVPSFHLTVTQKFDNTIYTTNGISVYQQANSKVIQVRPTLANDNADGLSVWLGSSANRYNKIYGLTYYYGNDNVEFSTKFVTTDTNQTISGSKTFSSNVNVYNSDSTANTPDLYLRSSKIEISSQGNTSGDQNLTYLDKNNTTYAYVKGAIQSNGTVVKIRSIAKDSSDNSVINELQILAYTNGNKAIFPSYSNEIDLGTSSYKWKSFNGLTPSSLGMPDIANKIDISSYITNLAGDLNNYTPPANGWICVQVDNSSVNNYIRCIYDVIMVKSSGNGQASALSCLIPVIANTKVGIRTVCTTLSSAYFIPCQGNI